MVVFDLAVDDGVVDASESCAGLTKVALSMIVAGSKMVTSAKYPGFRMPRLSRCSRCAGNDVILRMAEFKWH